MNAKEPFSFFLSSFFTNTKSVAAAVVRDPFPLERLNDALPLPLEQGRGGLPRGLLHNGGVAAAAAPLPAPDLHAALQRQDGRELLRDLKQGVGAAVAVVAAATAAEEGLQAAVVAAVSAVSAVQEALAGDAALERGGRNV